MGKKLQVKRGNVASMPILAAGELGFTTDTKKLYVGTGNENIPINGGFVEQDISGNAKLIGNLTLKGSGNFGNKINFGDGDYVHISEPADDTLELKGTRIKCYTGSTEVMKMESGKVFINGTEVGGSARSVTLDFGILCSSKGFLCSTIKSNNGYTETLTKTATAKKAAVRTTTTLSNGYKEVTTFYGEDGVAVVETRTKTITKTGNEYMEVTA